MQDRRLDLCCDYATLVTCDRKFIIVLMSQRVQQFEMTQMPNI